MRLTELKVLDVVVFHKWLSGNIEPGKEPTSSRTLLIGHGFPFCLNFVIENMDVVLQTSRGKTEIKLDNKKHFFHISKLLLSSQTSLQRIRSCTNILSEFGCVARVEIFLE